MIYSIPHLCAIEMPPSSRMVVDNRPYFPTLWFKGQFLHSAKYPSKSTDLTNKVAIVTGANQGLGYECARQFLGLHLSHLVLAVRSLSKGEAAAASLKKQYPKVNVEVRVLDMANYDSIQTFVSGLQNLPRIDCTQNLGKTYQLRLR